MKINKLFHKIFHFLDHDLWRIPLKEEEGFRYYLLKVARAFYVAIRGFYKDLCFLRSSALTFYTMMSIVPVLAMSFAIARGFGYQQHLEKEIAQHFGEQKKLVNEIISFAQNLLEQTKSGLLAGVGIVILFWSVHKVLHHIETSMNHVWNVKKNRSFNRKFSDYLALVIIAPLFFVVASSVTVFIVSKLQSYINELPLNETISSFILFLLKLFPYCLIWILFSFLYVFIPNTKVKILPAIFAGVIAGTVYQFTQWVYLFFQIGATRYNAIYGSFAALPLFLVWVYMSWIILLFGTELAYAYQNIHKYEYGWRMKTMNHRFQLLLSLWVVRRAIRYYQERRPLTKENLFDVLEIPYPMIETVFDELLSLGILARVDTKKDEYIMAMPFQYLTIKQVIDMIEYKGLEVPDIPSKSFHAIYGLLKEFSKEVTQSDYNKLMKEI